MDRIERRGAGARGWDSHRHRHPEVDMAWITNAPCWERSPTAVSYDTISYSHWTPFSFVQIEWPSRAATVEGSSFVITSLILIVLSGNTSQLHRNPVSK